MQLTFSLAVCCAFQKINVFCNLNHPLFMQTVSRDGRQIAQYSPQRPPIFRFALSSFHAVQFSVRPLILCILVKMFLNMMLTILSFDAKTCVTHTQTQTHINTHTHIQTHCYLHVEFLLLKFKTIQGLNSLQY